MLCGARKENRTKLTTEEKLDGSHPLRIFPRLQLHVVRFDCILSARWGPTKRYSSLKSQH